MSDTEPSEKALALVDEAPLAIAEITTEPSAEVLALLEDMNANRVRVGQRCWTCTKTTPEQRLLIRLAHKDGHSAPTIARRIREHWGTEASHHSIENHLRDGHDA